MMAESSEKLFCGPCCADRRTKNTTREKPRVRERDTACWFCVLRTPPSLTKESPLPASETPWVREKKSLIPWWRFPPWSCLPTWGWRACWWMVVPPPTRFLVDTVRTFLGPSILLTSSLSNLILGVDSGVALSMHLVQSLFSSFSFLVIVSLIHRSVFLPKCLVQASKNFHSCSARPLSRYKSDLRLQSHRSGRIILRPIGWRFVIFDNAGCSGTCPIWFCDHVFLPSSLSCELRNKLFASPLARDVLREMDLSLSRSSQSMKTANMFRKYSVQCLSSSMFNSCGSVLWKWSRTSRSTPCFPRCWSCPSTSRWMGWTLDPFPGRLSTLRDLDAFQNDESTCWLLRCGCHLVFGQLNVAILGFWCQCYRNGSPRTLYCYGFPVLSAKMVDGCFRFKVGSILTSRMQIRLEHNSLRQLKRLIHFTVQFFSSLHVHHLLDAHRGYVL